MSEEVQVEEKETSLRDDLVSAMSEVKQEEPVVESAPSTPELEAEKPIINIQEAIKPVVDDAPQSLTAAAKAKWNEVPAEIKAEWSKREADIHKQMTSADGELRMGREMKEVLTPYMAIIQSEGGTPATAVRDLLNTAYVLRTGSQEQKQGILQQVAQQYGVDLSFLGQSQDGQELPNDNITKQLLAQQKEIERLTQQTNPEYINNQLQEINNRNTIMSAIEIFSKDPANVHFAKVQDDMIAIAPSIKAKNPNASAEEILKKAYTAACRADDEIYSTLQNEIVVNQQAKKSQDITAKKKAASSVTGSPAITISNTGSPERDLREELRANIRAAKST